MKDMPTELIQKIFSLLKSDPYAFYNTHRNIDEILAFVVATQIHMDKKIAFFTLDCSCGNIEQSLGNQTFLIYMNEAVDKMEVMQNIHPEMNVETGFKA